MALLVDTMAPPFPLVPPKPGCTCKASFTPMEVKLSDMMCKKDRDIRNEDSVVYEVPL